MKKKSKKNASKKSSAIAEVSHVKHVQGNAGPVDEPAILDIDRRLAKACEFLPARRRILGDNMKEQYILGVETLFGVEID